MKTPNRRLSAGDVGLTPQGHRKAFAIETDTSIGIVPADHPLLARRKAFAYLRVSGKSQVEGDGFERQGQAIATHRGFKIVKTFRDGGVSGVTDLENRPGLTELVAALSEHKDVEAVIIEKLDRLARDLMVQETIIADMQKRGIELISCMEPDLCSKDPTRVLVRQIIGAIAQYAKAIDVNRMAVAKKRIRATGARCEGVKPFGAKPGELHILKVMRDLRGDNHSYDFIAATLEALGHKPRRGGKWIGATVCKILNREVQNAIA